MSSIPIRTWYSFSLTYQSAKSVGSGGGGGIDHEVQEQQLPLRFVKPDLPLETWEHLHLPVRDLPHLLIWAGSCISSFSSHFWNTQSSSFFQLSFWCSNFIFHLICLLQTFSLCTNRSKFDSVYYTLTLYSCIHSSPCSRCWTQKCLRNFPTENLKVQSLYQ